MEEMVKWLVGIEDAAAQAYRVASKLFHADPDFSGLLAELSKDEQGHHSAMCLATMYLKEIDGYPAVVSLDTETRWGIEAPFIELRNLLKACRIDRMGMMNYILTIEYSELNQLFLYVLDALRERTDGQIDLLLDVDEHKGRIESYIGAHPEFSEYAGRVKGLPKAPETKRILVVDDSRSDLEMLKAIFADRFYVDTATNGEDAFRMLGSGHYAAVVSDVDMPMMDGIELYRRARETIPGISGRFIFYTGPMNAERASFFNRQRLKYLTKPTPINTIRAAVADLA
ncbi:MAG: response regulator [Thermodesulfobacteriota bacterium]